MNVAAMKRPPMNRQVLTVIVAACVIVGLWLLSALYIVHQTQQALVVQFGNPVSATGDPGLHIKQPWPFQNVVYFDRRVLNLDLGEQEVIASDRKRLVVDAYARWRITDPLRFRQALIDEGVAPTRLLPILQSNVRRVLGAQTFAAVLSGQRATLMHYIRDGVNAETANFGIQIVDVRIRRADLPAQNSEAIYNRMKQERVREAAEYRAQGSEISQTIRSTADREATIIRAEATRDAEILRGEGDGEKNRIFAEAFNQDADFFAFYRSMQAYEGALPADNTSLVLSPDSEFFRYFERGDSGR